MSKYPGTFGRLTAALLLLLTVLAAPAKAEPGILRVGMADQTYPAGYRLEDGRMAGALVRMLRLIARDSGIELAVEGYPWTRTQLMVQKDELDAFIAVATDERRKYALFAPTAVLSAPRGIFYRAGDESVGKAGSMEQLIRFRQGGYLGDGWIRANFPADHIEWARTYEDLLHMVDAGRIDYMVGDAASADSRLKALGLDGKLAFRPLPFLEPLEYRFGLRGNYPDAAAVIERIEQGIVKARSGPDFAAASPPYH